MDPMELAGLCLAVAVAAIIGLLPLIIWRSK
jgi:hypothetical protein